ncbi:uncharacterized protein LOC110836161 [Zootermopsis nevadensis]|uniref:uncharacterized protein LOC110836161 n=1 Tax=Zootermopsis nevadensis TaxID=136037 RepID=UPI000B8E991A|nr:uncharacterized protein LOC110836161 [Zootermopsis nevadensis]
MNNHLSHFEMVPLWLRRLTQHTGVSASQRLPQNLLRHRDGRCVSWFSPAWKEGAFQNVSYQRFKLFSGTIIQVQLHGSIHGTAANKKRRNHLHPVKCPISCIVLLWQAAWRRASRIGVLYAKEQCRVSRAVTLLCGGWLPARA